MFNSHTQIGVLHTTENVSVDGSFKSLNQSHSAPHFIVGEVRIIQCRSSAHQAAALVGNGPVFANAQASIQIEMAALTGGGKNLSTTTEAETWHHDCGALRRRDMLDGSGIVDQVGTNNSIAPERDEHIFSN